MRKSSLALALGALVIVAAMLGCAALATPTPLTAATAFPSSTSALSPTPFGGVATQPAATPVPPVVIVSPTPGSQVTSAPAATPLVAVTPTAGA